MRELAMNRKDEPSGSIWLPQPFFYKAILIKTNRSCYRESMPPNKNTNPLEESGRSSRNIDPCIVVIFGATGDLTGRRLAPALYNLGREGHLPANFALVGFAEEKRAMRSSAKSSKRTFPNFPASNRLTKSSGTIFKNRSSTTARVRRRLRV